MPPQTRLKPSQRSEIIGAARSGVSLRDISNHLEVPLATDK